MVGPARKLGEGPPSVRGPRVVASDLATVETWGPAPVVKDVALRRSMIELQADLHGLIDDLRRGPLGRIETRGQEFLGELRKAFLRTHRRLTVHIRAEGGTDFTARARSEVAELARAFRLLALSRASMATHEAWSPEELSDAIDRLFQPLPSVLEAPIEEATFERTGGPFFLRLRRNILRARRWGRRFLGDTPPARLIELQSLLRHNFQKTEPEDLEGIAVLLVEADAHLEARARSLFEGVKVALEGLVDEPDELDQGLVLLRQQVEEELVLAEQELVRFLDDIERRSQAFLVGAVRGVKDELPRIGTFELPTRRRQPPRASERARYRSALRDHLDAARAVTAGGYVLLGLRLELAAFQAKVVEILEPEIVDIERLVRGRSQKQLERVRTELDDALAELSEVAGAAGGEGEARPSDRPNEQAAPDRASPARLDKIIADLDRVLKDAQRSAQQLIDQLTSENTWKEPLDQLGREARALTDFYTVPVRRLPPAEWTLPPAPPLVELPFSRVVANFIETDVAPQILATSGGAAASLQPMLAAFAEVERVVHLGGGQLDGEDVVVRELPGLGETREVLRAAFARARDELRALEGPADGWARDLARGLRGEVRARLEDLEGRLTEGGLAATAAESGVADGGGEAARARIRAGLGDLWGLLTQARVRGTRRVRAAVGEERLAGVRRALGIPSAPERGAEPTPFEPPQEVPELPAFYRRLFAGQATWAGDALEEHVGALRPIRRALVRRPLGGLRTAAVLGLEGAGRRALLGALTRGDRLGSVRRVVLQAPVTVSDVQDSLRDLSGDQVVVITGFSWLVSAAPGGFEPVRALVERILSDAGKNAFVLEADPLVWRWAASVAPLDDVVTELVTAPQLDVESLERTLLARHRLSGLELGFQSGEPEEQARARLFTDLHRASDGLLQVALAYWLASLAEVDEERGRVVVGSVPPSPHAALQGLDDGIFHPLFLVARQGWMSASVLAVVLGVRETDAEALLERMYGLGLLERHPNGVFTVRIHLGGALRRTLTERGWV